MRDFILKIKRRKRATGPQMSAGRFITTQRMDTSTASPRDTHDFAVLQAHNITQELIASTLESAVTFFSEKGVGGIFYPFMY